MIRLIKERIFTFFNEGHERTILTKKNIAASFAIKGLTILISLILVPLTINYVNPERNGIWLTIYSMVLWLNLFDVGLGNGMKNKLAEAKAKGENELAKKYVSSTYAIVGGICLIVFIVFCFINPQLDWIKMLGSGASIEPYRREISGLIWISMVAFCITFVFNLLKSVLIADQHPAISSFLDMLGQLFTLMGIFFLLKTTSPSLIYLGLVTGFAPIIVYVVASIYFFHTKYRDWRPSFGQVDFKLAKNMLNLGVKFFISTVAVIMVNQMIPFLILRITTSSEVTSFNVALRLFSFVFNIIVIVIIPYWSSFTDAYTKKDFLWMKVSITYLQRLFWGFLICQALLLFFAPVIYQVWINRWIAESDNIITIPFLMSLSVCLYICATCWMSIFMHPLNGIGKIKLQVYSSMFEMILFIPFALFLGHYWGAPGIVLTPVIIYIPRMIWTPVQLHQLISQKATGIWNK
ncbi:MAG: MATE family efflux transporter [Candidatus Azobacteroides sp.]|nr:MATE family efflux transporter [Candidatus Azobacteroides sp.]